MITGYTRVLDELGRIVLPADYQNGLNVTEGQRVNLKLVGDEIRVSKANPSCCLCGCEKNLKKILDKCICDSCQSLILELQD